MLVDPFEDDVPESNADVADGNDPIEDFIDQMDASSTLPGSGVERVRKRSVPSTRRVWTFVEEKELMYALKDLVVKGQKCDNGFRSGYLLLLENVLSAKFLGNSGIGLNSTTYRIDALPEVWDAHIKVDPTTRSLKNKTFPFYAKWFEIFGNDRANDSDSQHCVDVVQEVLKQSTKHIILSSDSQLFRPLFYYLE
ncbi:hypothetical protein ACS0TY_014553 [Phlomoides rotata]